MKKYKDAISFYILVLGIGISAGYFLYVKLNIFATSNFFSGIITLVVGSVAIYLYLRQKIDFKRDNASIILMEIRHAEKSLDGLKSGNAIINQFDIKILPTNNWKKYNYLFIDDLDRDELDLINNFYNQCEIIDKNLEQISINVQLAQKHNCLHQAIIQIALEESKIDPGNINLNEQNFKSKKERFLELTKRDNTTFIPDATKNAIDRALKSAKNITTTSAGNILKKIAKLK